MTVNTTISSQRFTGNGATVAWPFNFKFFVNSDIQAVVITPLGVETPLVLGVDYTLTGAGTAMGGTLTTTVPVADLDTLVVSRILVPNQLTDLRNQGEFFPEIHEDVFDRLTMLIQQALNNNGQALLFPISDPAGLSKTLPNQADRALRVMAFDAAGQPAVSNLTLAVLEQQPAMAAAAAAAAANSASDAAISAASSSVNASAAAGSAAAAAASAASMAGASVPLFSVQWCPSRALLVGSDWSGYIPADGQLDIRALYPAAWAGINAGNVPTAADATWLADLDQRLKYTAGNGTTTFRWPDYNGKSAGSRGAVFLRGDGALSGGTAGTMQRDALQDHRFTANFRRSVDKLTADRYTTQQMGTVYSAGGTGAAADGVTISPTAPPSEPTTSYLVPTFARISDETRPLSATGCWVIKAFGSIVNQGSLDAAALAAAQTAQGVRITALETININEAWYSGGYTAYVGNTAQVFTHNRGAALTDFRLTLRARTANNGFSVGDELPMQGIGNDWASATPYGFQIQDNGPNSFTVRPASGGPRAALMNKGTGGLFTPTYVDWEAKFEGRRTV